MTRPADPPTHAAAGALRLDKWLWAARFYKTRSLATDEVGKGRVTVNGQPAKPARDVRPGDEIELRAPGTPPRTVVVLALSTVRGPAPVAQALYAETPASIERRRLDAEQRRLGAEPAQALVHGRPTKRDRRDLDKTHGGWQRWSASIDD